MLNAIFAVDSEFGIGKNNSMPWHFPEDFKFFKETTINSTIVMGNNTWLSLPKRPLPDRYNVVITSLYEHSVHKDADLVITSDKLYFSTGVVRRRYSILLANEIKQLAEHTNKETFIIGGAQLLTSLLPVIERMYITVVPGVYDCDVFFNPFEHSDKFVLAKNTPLVNKHGARSLTVGEYVWRT